MNNTFLLSEVHPHNKIMMQKRGRRTLRYLPMVQAQKWFDLVTAEDIKEFKKTDPPNNFQAEISFIADRCRSRGGNLILRDYNNVDFTGINYHAEPPRRFLTVEALQDNFDIVRFFTVRHPADQWISLSKIFTDDITQRLERFLYGFRLFSEQAAETGFVRYEDFTRDPEAELKKICQRLDLPFDASWRERWASYKNITGDSRAKFGNSDITPQPKKVTATDLCRRLEESTDYRKSLNLLGYET